MILTNSVYESMKRECIETWKGLLNSGTQIVTPEQIVNNAWRALVIGNFMIAVGDQPNYSAGNVYGHLYEGECSDTLRSFLLFGQTAVCPGMLKSMLDFRRENTRFHVAGQKLQLLAFAYWLTHDRSMIRDLKPDWRPSVDLILNSRQKESGLLPKDRYAGDLAKKVYSLDSNAN